MQKPAESTAELRKRTYKMAKNNVSKNIRETNSRNIFTKTVHNHEPDYSRPTYELPRDTYDKILKRMIFLYGQDVAEIYMPELERIIKKYYAHKPLKMIEEDIHIDPENRFNEKSIVIGTKARKRYCRLGGLYFIKLVLKG